MLMRIKGGAVRRRRGKEKKRNGREWKDTMTRRNGLKKWKENRKLERS